MRVDGMREQMGGRGRARQIAVSLAAVAIAATAALGTSALRPPEAHAWAWKDTCTPTAYNLSGSQSAVRPALYLAVVPSFAAESTYATFALVGIPTSGGIPFSNSGYPVPAYGCHGTLNFINPGSNVLCAYSAPTTGANHFGCQGNAKVTITKDDDDISADIRIAEKTTGDTGDAVPDVGSVRAALRPTDLPDGGWRSSGDIADLGALGELMRDDTLAARCKDDDDSHLEPDAVRTSLLSGAGGTQAVGTVELTMSNRDEAGRMLDEAMSAHSMRCLSQLLTSPAAGTTVTVTSLDDENVQGARLAVQRPPILGAAARTDYLDVIGLTVGRRTGITMLEGDGQPLPAAVATAARTALEDDLGA